MLKHFEADGRDVALAAFAAFMGALAVGTGSIAKDALVAAGWGALRAGIGVVAVKLQAAKAAKDAK